MQHIFNKVYFRPYQESAMLGMIYKKAVLSQGNRAMPL